MFNIDITRKDLHTLKDGVWLNDEVMILSHNMIKIKVFICI